MALAKCVECGNDISSSAKTCPHCGIKHVQENTGWSFFDWVGTIIFIIAMYAWDPFSMFSSDTNNWRQESIGTLLQENTDKISENKQFWTTSYYLDEFGEPTSLGYITTSLPINGTYSNTATQNSELKINFLISNSSEVSIMLYKYSNNPVKTSVATKYKVLMQDNIGNRFTLTAIHNLDRFVFDAIDSKRIHDSLIKGGNIKFKIIEIDSPTTEYNFKVNIASSYDNIYKKLTNKEIR